jgi:hypothetical protein
MNSVNRLRVIIAILILHDFVKYEFNSQKNIIEKVSAFFNIFVRLIFE